MRARRALRLAFLAAALAVAALIFLFSAQTAEESSYVSGRLTERLLRAVTPGWDSFSQAERETALARVDVAVRKAGHFGEYALLGALLAGFFLLKPRLETLARAVPPAWGAAVLYACTDEAHQMFVDGRGPSFLDVGIDSLGALAGALIALAVAAGLLRRVRRENV